MIAGVTAKIDSWLRSKEGITIYDPDYVSDEERYIDIGLSSKGRLIVVSYIERGKKIRIISSREATRKEQGEYENK